MGLLVAVLDVLRSPDAPHELNVGRYLIHRGLHEVCPVGGHRIRVVGVDG